MSSSSALFTSASSSPASASSSSLKATHQTTPSTPATKDASAVTIPANSIGLRYLHDFLTADECKQLIALAEKSGWVRSLTRAGVDDRRTSQSSIVSRSDPVVASTLRRVAEMTQTKPSHIEVDVIKYEPGMLFKPHHDTATSEINPRRYTVLVYLNDVEGEGGETEFLQLDVRVKPKRGAALIWENTDERKVLRQASQHQGFPPKSGVKMILNFWICFDPVSYLI